MRPGRRLRYTPLKSSLLYNAMIFHFSPLQPVRLVLCRPNEPGKAYYLRRAFALCKCITMYKDFYTFYNLCNFCE